MKECKTMYEKLLAKLKNWNFCFSKIENIFHNAKICTNILQGKQ